jgi:pimeloyl-ACP methyl ester carboxylesterase
MIRISVGLILALGIVKSAAAQTDAGSAAISAIPKVPAVNYSHPARLVAVDTGRRLNLLCMGKGSPTVLLESGAGVGAVSWRPIQAAIAQFTRVCAYDRAGYGFSDPISRPSTAANFEDDLHRLVIAAKLKAPLVLVGHSAGGNYVQMFATDYPELTAGVVLVAATGRNSERYVWQILTEQEKAGTIRFARAAKTRRLDCLAKARAGTINTDKTCFPLPTGDPLLDAELARQNATVKHRDAVNSELDNFETIDGTGEGGVSREQLIAKPFKLGDKPLVVLLASSGVPPGERGDKLRALAADEVAQTMAASPQSKRLVVSGSRHVIHDDRPDVVVSTIKDVVDQLRSKSMMRRKADLPKVP